jgi:hypothetical protein
MKSQSLLLALGFIAVAVFSTRCDCNKPDDNNVTPITSCDTCTIPTSCAQYACTSKPPKCPTCIVINTGVCSGSETPIFKGKINTGGGVVNFETSFVKAYQYVATQGVLKGKKTIIITAQNKDGNGKINETFNICLDASVGGSPYTISSTGNSRFAYLKPTGLAYSDSPLGSVIINPIGPDSLLSGSISSLVSNIKGQPSNQAQLSNVTFSNICFKPKLQSLTTTNTTFEMPTVAGNQTANYKATKVTAHIGEGPDIGKLVIEAENSKTPRAEKFVIKIPFNILSNASVTAFKFPNNADPSLADFYASYNDGATASSADYVSNNGVPNFSCILGGITHNKETRIITINSINLKLNSSTAGLASFGVGKLTAKY